MQQIINLCIISNRSSYTHGIQSLISRKSRDTFPKNTNIMFHGRYFDNTDSALKSFCSKGDNSSCSSIKKNDIILLDDLSLDKIQILNFINNIHSCFRFSSIKTVVYTNSLDGEYLNRLKQLEVKAILHDKETPLKDAFHTLDINSKKSLWLKQVQKEFEADEKALERDCMRAGKHENKTEVSSNLISLLHIQTYKKLLDILDLVIIGKTYYAAKVNAIISGYIWARRENESLNIYGNVDARIYDTKIPLSILNVKKKIRGLIVSAAPMLASVIMMLCPDDGISFEQKASLDLNKRNQYGLLCESKMPVNYDLIILDDNSDTAIGESLLKEAPDSHILLAKYNSRIAGYKNSSSKIILYTRSKDILYLRRLRDKEEVSLLHESSFEKRFADAVNDLLKGNIYIDPTIDKKICEYHKYLSTHPLSKLTNCQLKVLYEISNGWKNHRIAEKLFITIDAVEKHKTRIEHALNITTEELSHFAIENREETKYLLEFTLTALHNAKS